MIILGVLFKIVIAFGYLSSREEFHSRKLNRRPQQWKRNFFPVSCQPAQDVTFFHLFYELGNKLCLIIEYGTNFQMTPLYVSTYLHILAASLAVILPLVVMVNNDH